MKKGTVLALLLVVLGGGYGLGRLATRDKDNSNSPAGAAAMPTTQGPSDGVDRVRVALEGPMKGPADAKVTIVEFSDFQCPFCSRVVPTVDKIMKDYPKQVRLFFRHNPLPFHDKASLAAEAAVAAEAQGKFWEMHDKMFGNQQALDRAGLEKDAQEIGLDMNKFKAALDSHSGKARVDADLAAGKQIGVQGTPNFYIDGRNVQGAQPYEEFKKVIDDEIARADKLIAKGTAPAMVYTAFMKGAKASPTAPAAGKGPGAGTEVYKVAVGDAPTRGGNQPKVTIVEYSDFQCPYCRRERDVLVQVMKEYGSRVRLVVKHTPLSIHPQARPAALLYEAIARRDPTAAFRFYDDLFEHQEQLAAGGERFLAAAARRALGDDADAARRTLDDARGAHVAAVVAADEAEARRLGFTGTPGFLINGVAIEGAYPLATFQKIIDRHLGARGHDAVPDSTVTAVSRCTATSCPPRAAAP